MAFGSIIWRLNFKERPANMVPCRCQQGIGFGRAGVHSADSWNAVIQGSVVLMLMGKTLQVPHHFSYHAWFGGESCELSARTWSLALSLTVAWVWKVSWPMWTSYFMSVKCSSWIRGLWKPRVSLILSGMHQCGGLLLSVAECFISSLVFVFPALGPPRPSDKAGGQTPMHLAPGPIKSKEASTYS